MKKTSKKTPAQMNSITRKQLNDRLVEIIKQTFGKKAFTTRMFRDKCKTRANYFYNQWVPSCGQRKHPGGNFRSKVTLCDFSDRVDRNMFELVRAGKLNVDKKYSHTMRCGQADQKIAIYRKTWKLK
jgi:hypothetical protein